VADPGGVEGPAGQVPGLGMLAVDTVLGGDKHLVAVTGRSVDGVSFRGYEMHVGRTTGAWAPLLQFDDGRVDGAVSADGLVMGCYVHGLFAEDGQRAAWLRMLGTDPAPMDYEAGVDAVLDGLAAHLEAHIDVARLLALAR
jgi:adenosylcobyric acid synthase